MQEEASSKLIELKDAGEDAWKTFKDGVQSAGDNTMGGATDSAISKFK